MSEVLQTNIFFFITSVAVIAVTILIIAVLFYVLMIARNIKSITDELREGSKAIAADLTALRQKFKEGGTRLQSLVGLFLDRLVARAPRRARRPRKPVEEEAGKSGEETS